MVKIEINGEKLHEVSMKLRQDKYGSTHLRYPDHKITYESEGDGITINLPLQLALALYYQKIVSQDKSKALNITIKGKNKGLLKVEDLIYPDSMYSQDVKLKLKMVK